MKKPKKPKKPKKKSKKSSKKKKLDRRWATLVKERAGGHCEYCGKTEYLNAHHIFSRNNHSVRWALENGVALCPSCHVFGNHSAHKAPIEFSEWLKETRGEKWFNDLRAKAKTVSPNIDLDEVEQHLTSV